MSLTLLPLETVSSCSTCGKDVSIMMVEAQQQIEDLKSQVLILTSKATAAVDKWADYEDQIQGLRTQLEQQRPAESPSTLRSPGVFGGYSIPSFLSRRNSAQPVPKPPPTPTSPELLAELSREKALREAAEGKLNETSGQIEELSAQLFQQANEMVATERKERAKLELRVRDLEKRDVEKKQRLERLEGALKRIERVRGLLAPSRMVS